MSNGLASTLWVAVQVTTCRGGPTKSCTAYHYLGCKMDCRLFPYISFKDQLSQTVSRWVSWCDWE